MISNSAAVFAVLVGIEILILLLKKPLKKLYDYIPPLVWMYFIPMFFTTAGILPSSSVVYEFINSYLLPASLFLIMLSSSIRGISKIGFQSVLAMLVGTLGMIMGSILGYIIFKSYLPPEGWKALAALSASWIGGSANMMGVFESFRAPPELLSPIIIVDTVVAYIWLPLLIFLSRFQKSFDSRVGVNDEVMEYMGEKAKSIKIGENAKPTLKSLMILVPITFSAVCIVSLLSKYLPSFEGISSFVWVIVLITALGVLLSLTKAQDILGSSSSGYLLLYLFLISIGAKSSLVDLGATPAVFGFGFVALSVHVVLLLLLIKVLKMPMFLFASASMANIGGTASASVVASVYNKSLIPIAIIISVLGYVTGMYGGLIVGGICSML
jgi:uncharacterized membrane protein